MSKGKSEIWGSAQGQNEIGLSERDKNRNEIGRIEVWAQIKWPYIVSWVALDGRAKRHFSKSVKWKIVPINTSILQLQSSPSGFK